MKATSRDNGTSNNDADLIHPKAEDEIRKRKHWISKKDIEILKREESPLPNRVIDCIEALLLHHLTNDDNHQIFIANHRLMTDAIDAGVEMTKGDLFEVIRKHHEFVNSQVVTFLYGETRHLTNSDGHWLVFAVDFTCDTVFVYDSCNRFKGVSEAFEKLKKVFIKP